MLIVNDESNQGIFEWRFNTKSECDQFRNSRYGDVLTSVKFNLCGCVFYFEITPNGWGRVLPIGFSGIWLAVSSLPSGIKSVFVDFHVLCAAVGFEETCSKNLVEPGNHGSFSSGRGKIPVTEFKDLEQWMYECTVTINSMRRKDGSLVAINEQVDSPIPFSHCLICILHSATWC